MTRSIKIPFETEAELRFAVKSLRQHLSCHYMRQFVAGAITSEDYDIYLWELGFTPHGYADIPTWEEA